MEDKIRKEMNIEKINIEEIKTFSDQEKITFLKEYYSYIDKKELEKAYQISAKVIKFETFNNWYKDIEYLKINNIKKIN
jgi:hypothetical protein